MRTANYQDQLATWPKSGRHIMAHFDEESITVYQAYRPAIGDYAAKHGYFGGEFSLGRMSWIKPNFLWMMYRSGWGSKPGQEVVLAIRLKREAFDKILASAIHSSFVPELYKSRRNWQEQVKSSDVRLQWDPDHAPNGAKEERRAVQLGLRGETLRHYASGWLAGIEDISDFVYEQRAHLDSLADLKTPTERVYPVHSRDLRTRLGLSEWELSEVAEG